MKTPKRETTFCPNCYRDKKCPMEVKWEANTEHEICSAFIFERARWKRKNREAQLKRSITRLKRESKFWERQCTFLYARFGQDVEGS